MPVRLTLSKCAVILVSVLCDLQNHSVSVFWCQSSVLTTAQYMGAFTRLPVGLSSIIYCSCTGVNFYDHLPIELEKGFGIRGQYTIRNSSAIHQRWLIIYCPQIPDTCPQILPRYLKIPTDTSPDTKYFVPRYSSILYPPITVSQPLRVTSWLFWCIKTIYRGINRYFITN